MMFSAHCPVHGTAVLMSDRNVVALRNEAAGPVLHFRCDCGHVGRLTRTRRRR